jgi:hypothetical protein
LETTFIVVITPIHADISAEVQAAVVAQCVSPSATAT